MMDQMQQQQMAEQYAAQAQNAQQMQEMQEEEGKLPKKLTRLLIMNCPVIWISCKVSVDFVTPAFSFYS